MVDEQQLVSLVLLLQLPPNSSSNSPVNDGVKSAGTKKDTDNSAQSFNTSTKQLDDSSTLQAALEHNNCKLLCFIGRLIHQYTITKDISKSSYAYLRLAIRILFLRYVSIDTHSILPSKDNHQHDSDTRVQEYEQYILLYIIEALIMRSKYELVEVDIEMAWVVQSLLVKRSKNKLWTDAIDTLVLRRKEGISSSNENKINEPPKSDEEIMIKTIHSILDGDTSSEDNQDMKDWILQYNISLISCLQTYLHRYTNDSDTVKADNVSLWTQQTLFNLIYWSQEKDSLSIDVYKLILQYLHTCIIRACSKDNGSSNRQRSMNQFYSAGVVVPNKKEPESVEEFANAIRSFVFYGLVVMGNTTTNTEQLSSSSTRGEVYSLALELWQLCGVDWMITPATETTKGKKLWWFQEEKMKDSEHRLGSTWPLCMLVSLAAGEFRLALGRWVTIVMSEQNSAKDYKYLVSEIHYTARIVTEAVQLMTQLAEDEDILTTWTPDAILHIRKSLEDALNSSIQYFNTLFADFEVEQTTSATPMSDAQRDVGQTCCLVVGMIAAELEVDHLLAPPVIDKQNSLSTKDDKEHQNMSSFGHALRGAVLFCCLSLGTMHSKAHHDPPLTHLLPCIISLVSTGDAGQEEYKSSGVEDALQFALDGLCKDNLFLNGLSQLFDRTTTQLNELHSTQNNLDAQTVKSMMSTINLCLDVIAEFSIAGDNTSGRLVLPNSKETQQKLSQLRSRAAVAMEVYGR